MKNDPKHPESWGQITKDTGLPLPRSYNPKVSMDPKVHYTTQSSKFDTVYGKATKRLDDRGHKVPRTKPKTKRAIKAAALASDLLAEL